jgi:hypothetical protein
MRRNSIGGAANSKKVNVPYSSQFRIGNVSVRISGDRTADVALISSLEPFSDKGDAVDISVGIERTSRLSYSPVSAAFDSGSVWQLHERDHAFQFDFNAPTMGEGPYKRLIVDREFRNASLLIHDERFRGDADSASPLDYPLDELLIMHRLTQEKAIELHSCGIVRADGIGNLFVGHSGAGKSTTTRLWTEREDVEVLSDDRIIVRLESAETQVPPPCFANGRNIRFACTALPGTARRCMRRRIVRRWPGSLFLSMAMATC